MSQAGDPAVSGATAPGLSNGRTDLTDEGLRQEVERQIRRLDGVTAARVVAGDRRPIDELHIVATKDRSPKQLSRDVQSLLVAQFGFEVDHRVISVVQVAEDRARAPQVAPGGTREPLLKEVTTSDASLTVEATVVVGSQGDEHRGTAHGPASLESRLNVVGRATLSALEPLLPDGYAVDLLRVELASVSLTDRTVIATVNAQTARHDQLLSGSAVVRRDVHTAAARSVLDAVNRLLARDAALPL